MLGFFVFEHTFKRGAEHVRTYKAPYDKGSSTW